MNKCKTYELSMHKEVVTYYPCFCKGYTVWSFV